MHFQTRYLLKMEKFLITWTKSWQLWKIEFPGSARQIIILRVKMTPKNIILIVASLELKEKFSSIHNLLLFFKSPQFFIDDSIFHLQKLPWMNTRRSRLSFVTIGWKIQEQDLVELTNRAFCTNLSYLAHMPNICR